MTVINAFYRNANAVSYADQLFGNGQQAPGTGFGQSSGTALNGYVGNAAADRALARIVEILSLGPDAGDAPAVSETMGYVTGAAGTDGDDTMTLTGRGINDLNAGAGNDRITAKSASITNIAGGGGKDTLQLSAAFVGGIDGGADDDEIGIIGKLALDIAGGAGDDTIKIAADTIIGADGGDGDDTMTLEGTRIFASGGRGNDTVTIRQKGSDAYAEYAFAAGDGEDRINTDGPLAIRFTGIAPDALTVTRSGDTLTASVAGSNDKITVTLDGGQDATYSLVADEGGYVLKVGWADTAL
ncbi:RTX toxin [Rhizobium halophytocola]|uniref:Calcium-binding protein n=1 Tax=Rhizobium halophytocola TaxID=735519 RepID=A0ABS4DYJ8_9HYPH|nr:RTX toxin [Rhizobium halophytocola]MBP1850761.1 hypothetical protein [Rhizobium halophytocola]